MLLFDGDIIVGDYTTQILPVNIIGFIVSRLGQMVIPHKTDH